MTALMKRDDVQLRPEDRFFSVEMEPGQEELWRAVRDLPRFINAHDLATHAGVSRTRAQAFLSALEKRGKISVEESDSVSGEPIYRRGQLEILPMVLDGNGKPSADFEKRHAIWTTIRALKTFTVTALWNIVKDHIKVQRWHVEAVVKRLEQGSYLVRLTDGDRDEDEFHLRPAMNTGPLPPRFCEAELVYDINRGTFYGRGLAREVKL